MKKYEKKFILKFIDIFDNLEIVKVFLKKNLNKHLLRFFDFNIKDLNIKVIKPRKFDDFNPYIHQAIFVNKKCKRLVYKVLKKGYIFKNSIIRPALVCLF